VFDLAFGDGPVYFFIRPTLRIDVPTDYGHIGVRTDRCLLLPTLSDVGWLDAPGIVRRGTALDVGTVGRRHVLAPVPRKCLFRFVLSTIPRMDWPLRPLLPGGLGIESFQLVFDSLERGKGLREVRFVRASWMARS
jgi:hypothetical protein